MTINKQALLIENGQLVADTLRHLANNEIDSDYFAIVSESENGTENEHELVITDYALQAAGAVDELVKALEAAEKRIAKLSTERSRGVETLQNELIKARIRSDNAEKRIAELESERDKQGRHACELFDEAKAQRQRVAELEASHSKLRESMAAIHNTIRLDGVRTHCPQLWGPLNARMKNQRPPLASRGSRDMADVILHNADCFDIYLTIANGSLDLVCADIPYGTTQCRWDSVLDLPRENNEA